MAHYQFDTEWVLDAPIQVVFDLLHRPDPTADWGPSSVRSTLEVAGDEHGVGRRARYRIRSPLFYSISFVAEIVDVIPLRRVASTVVGDLAGTGTYETTAVREGTKVEFHWHVSTTKRWMNLIEPVARPLFAWAHDRVVGKAILAMARHLDTELVSWSSTLQPTN